MTGERYQKLKAHILLALEEPVPTDTDPAWPAWRLPYIVERVLLPKFRWWWPDLWEGGRPYVDGPFCRAVDDLVTEGRVIRASHDHWLPGRAPRGRR